MILSVFSKKDEKDAVFKGIFHGVGQAGTTHFSAKTDANLLEIHLFLSFCFISLLSPPTRQLFDINPLFDYPCLSPWCQNDQHPTPASSRLPRACGDRPGSPWCSQGSSKLV